MLGGFLAVFGAQQHRAEANGDVFDGHFVFLRVLGQGGQVGEQLSQGVEDGTGQGAEQLFECVETFGFAVSDFFCRYNEGVAVAGHQGIWQLDQVVHQQAGHHVRVGTGGAIQRGSEFPVSAQGVNVSASRRDAEKAVCFHGGREEEIFEAFMNEARVVVEGTAKDQAAIFLLLEDALFVSRRIAGLAGSGDARGCSGAHIVGHRQVQLSRRRRFGHQLRGADFQLARVDEAHGDGAAHGAVVLGAPFQLEIDDLFFGRQ